MTFEFRAFEQAEDKKLVEFVNDFGEFEPNENDFESVCSEFNRSHYVLIQRAFQLSIISYSELGYLLLSHRQDGWRSDEIDTLISHCGLSRKRLAIILGRTVQSVKKQVFEFRLAGGGGDYHWSIKEKNTLKKLLGNQPFYSICEKLNRPAIDVKHMSVKMQLARSGVFNQFTGRLPKLNTKTNQIISLYA
tara:strand:+ start:1603 stop:2175 length:573 start_codon:yes stop_codon:yes gene_type:complete